MVAKTYDLHQARLLRDFIRSGATVEDLARAWASMEGKVDKFDEEKHISALDVVYGHYHGFIAETEEILRRATHYAEERRHS